MSQRLSDLQQYRNWQFDRLINPVGVVIGPVPHPDLDKCPENCDSKHAHAMYRHGVASQRESMKGSARIKDISVGCANPDHAFSPDQWCLGCNPSRDDAFSPEFLASVEDAQNKPLTATVPTDGKTIMLGQVAYWNPMTLARAVAVLNERKHRMRTNWTISCGLRGTDGSYVYSDIDEGDLLTPFEAIAIAEKIEREGK